MTQKTDPQIKDETSRQRAYDESATTPAQGDNPPPETDRGFLRNDGAPRPAVEGGKSLEREDKLVVAPSDERHPNAPDTLNADTGAKRSDAADGDIPSAAQELSDAYTLAEK